MFGLNLPLDALVGFLVLAAVGAGTAGADATYRWLKARPSLRGTLWWLVAVALGLAILVALGAIVLTLLGMDA